jgi:hypothetical protein
LCCAKIDISIFRQLEETLPTKSSRESKLQGKNGFEVLGTVKPTSKSWSSLKHVPNEQDNSGGMPMVNAAISRKSKNGYKLSDNI